MGPRLRGDDESLGGDGNRGGDRNGRDDRSCEGVRSRGDDNIALQKIISTFCRSLGRD